MNLNLIELDIRKREEALNHCKITLKYTPNLNKDQVKILKQEIFYLKDQLDKLRVVAGILRDEYGSMDEMLPRV